MKKVKEYLDPKNTISYAFAVTREEWEQLRQGKTSHGGEKNDEDS